MSTLPQDPRLAAIAEVMQHKRGAAALVDPGLKLVWVSEELKDLLGERDEKRLGYGRHIVECYMSETWRSRITEESQVKTMLELFPNFMYDTEGGKEGLSRIFCDAVTAEYVEGDLPPPASLGSFEGDVSEFVDGLFASFEPAEPPLVWGSDFEFVQGALPPMRIYELHFRLIDDDGTLLGTAIVYDPALRATVLALVARGDEGMFGRMAELIEPGRKRAAILFADLQSSAALSRRLPSAAYFRLIRALTTAIDEIVASHNGIVGKHAGDGASAFFIAEQIGSSSRATREAIEAARDIVIAARDAAKEVGEETGLIDPEDCLVNVAVHWGGTLYMGQLVTGGRLEVTALGDEVNECSRIQEAARDGRVLASKSLVEHLSDDDARAIGIDPDGLLYRTVAELPEVSEKAARDAGGIPVTAI